MFDMKEYQRQYYINNYEKVLKRHRQWYEDNPDYDKQYYEDNKDKKLKKFKQYYKDNHKGIRKQQKQHYEDNHEKEVERVKQYLKTENGKATAQRNCTKRRAKMKEIINTLTAEEWLDILKEHKYKCFYCGKEFDLFDLPTKDHILPISKGGNNIKENVVPACRSCNAKKGNNIILSEAK